MNEIDINQLIAQSTSTVPPQEQPDTFQEYMRHTERTEHVQAMERQLDAISNELKAKPDTMLLGAMSPEGKPNSEELFGIAAPENKTLRTSTIDGELAIELHTERMSAFAGEEGGNEFVVLPNSVDQNSDENKGYGSLGQAKYLRRKNTIRIQESADHAGFIKISELEKGISEMKKEDSQKFSAEFLAAVYLAKLEPHQQAIESVVAQQGIPKTDFGYNPGQLSTEKNKSWTYRDPESGDRRGGQWLWIEERDGNEVLVFPSNESLSVIYLPDQRRFLFNIEAQPAQAYERGVILNGGADEGKIKKKLTAQKEAGEEHNLNIEDDGIIELGTIYGAPDRIKGGSNMHIAIGHFIEDEETKKKARVSADEVTEIFPGTFSREQVQWMILHGKIKDARTIAGFYMAEIYLQNHPEFLAEQEAEPVAA